EEDHGVSVLPRARAVPAWMAVQRGEDDRARAPRDGRERVPAVRGRGRAVPDHAEARPGKVRRRLPKGPGTVLAPPRGRDRGNPVRGRREMEAAPRARGPRVGPRPPLGSWVAGGTPPAGARTRPGA